jgi:hypothetical protein
MASIHTPWCTAVRTDVLLTTEIPRRADVHAIVSAGALILVSTVPSSEMERSIRRIRYLVVRTLIPNPPYQQKDQYFNDALFLLFFPVTPMLCCSTQRNRYRHMSPHQHQALLACGLEFVRKSPVLLLYSFHRFAHSCTPRSVQKLVPSGGCGSFLLAGAAMYRRISMSTVSMVKSRFQFAMLGSLERSTCGWTWMLVCCTLRVACR